MISKTHHCLVDGVSGADIMSVLLDLEPEPEKVERRPWRPEPEPSTDQLLMDALRERVTSPGEAIRTLQSELSDPTGLPGKIVEGLKAIGSLVGSSFSAPPSSLNQPIGPHRRFETVLAGLDEIKSVKNHFGGTVNDVVLTVVAGGLRRLLKGRGENVDDMELRAMVPVSVRADSEAGALGNRVATMWAALPIYEPDPIERLRIVSDEMKDLKSSGQAVGAQMLTALGEWAPPTILAQASRLVARQRAFNLVVTNVPGPQFPLYSLGRQMQEVYPVLPLSVNQTLGVALLSYNGTVGFGLLGDYDTGQDIGVLAEGIEKSIAELTASTG
jgi:diacylglycerol O-acyltransferase / wax synthase